MPLLHPSTPMGTPVPVAVPAARSVPQAWRVLPDPAVHPFCLTTVTGG